MLTIVFIYFVGRTFYKLAETYGKSKWGYAVLGVISYYVGGVVLGGLLTIAIVWLTRYTVEDFGALQITLMFVPFGILSCVTFYLLLRKRWKRNEEEPEDPIDEIGKS